MVFVQEIKFADIGEGITEGHIVKLNYKDNDKVSEDEGIMQIETDKAVVTIPTPIDGYIKYKVKEGDTVKVGVTLALVGTEDEINSDTNSNPVQSASEKIPDQKAEEKKDETKVDMNVQSNRNEILATPGVKKLALDMNIDITKVHGTGPHGKIMKEDLLNYKDQGAPAKIESSNNQQAQSNPQVPANKITVDNSNKGAAGSSDSFGPIEAKPLSFLRKAIAKNMVLSSKIPTASHMDLIDSGNLYEILSKNKDMFLKRFNVKLTFLPFMIKAVVQALKDNPNFNASYDEDKEQLILKKYYNIGIAAATKDGLKVIVIKDADKKSILEIAEDLINLRDKLYNNTISISEMKGNSFTITNIGSLGGGFMGMPIINPPDVAILSFGVIRDTPIVKNGEVVPGKVMEFTLTFDHRVTDGADAAKFGNDLKSYLENPYLLTLI